LKFVWPVAALSLDTEEVISF